jgi:hypothetical protein
MSRQLINEYRAERHRLTDMGSRLYLDGAQLQGLRVPFGNWETKDEADSKIDQHLFQIRLHQRKKYFFRESR